MLLTRSPLSLARSFDLHGLGTPPAFILSQDQTLRIIFRFIKNRKTSLLTELFTRTLFVLESLYHFLIVNVLARKPVEFTHFAFACQDPTLDFKNLLLDFDLLSAIELQRAAYSALISFACQGQILIFKNRF